MEETEQRVKYNVQRRCSNCEFVGLTSKAIIDRGAGKEWLCSKCSKEMKELDNLL